jgi:PRTRC genetic system protein C
MTIRKMTRSFRYAGLILPDPATDLDVESVRSLYAASYPEITTAALTGPEAVDGTLVYTFTKAISLPLRRSAHANHNPIVAGYCRALHVR